MCLTTAESKPHNRTTSSLHIASSTSQPLTRDVGCFLGNGRRRLRRHGAPPTTKTAEARTKCDVRIGGRLQAGYGTSSLGQFIGLFHVISPISRHILRGHRRPKRSQGPRSSLLRSPPHLPLRKHRTATHVGQRVTILRQTTLPCQEEAMRGSWEAG